MLQSWEHTDPLTEGMTVFMLVMETFDEALGAVHRDIYNKGIDANNYKGWSFKCTSSTAQGDSM
jgi:hypothetical protein